MIEHPDLLDVALPLLIWLTDIPLARLEEPFQIRRLRRGCRCSARLVTVSSRFRKGSGTLLSSKRELWSAEMERALSARFVDEARRWYVASHCVLETELGTHVLSCIYDGGLGLSDFEVDEVRYLLSELRPLTSKLWRALLEDREQFEEVSQESSSSPMREKFLEARSDMLLYRVRALHEILELPITEDVALQLRWDETPDFDVSERQEGVTSATN
jgi:hypothetical protein